MGAAHSGDRGQQEEKSSDILSESCFKDLIPHSQLDIQLSNKKTSKKSILESQTGIFLKG
jgi:hypothetical protein